MRLPNPVRHIGLRFRFLVPPMIAVGVFSAATLLIFDQFREQRRTLDAVRQVDMVRRDAAEEIAYLTSRNHVALFNVLGEAGPEIGEAAFYARAKPLLDDFYAIESELKSGRERFAHGNADAAYDTLVEVFASYRNHLVSAVLMSTVEIRNTKQYMVLANTSYQILVDGFKALTDATAIRSRTSLDALDVSADRVARVLIASLAGTVVAVLLLSYVLSGFLTRQLRSLIDAMSTLAHGGHEVAVAGAERGDEIGALARATAVFRDTLIERDRTLAEKTHAEAALRRTLEERERTARALSEREMRLAAVVDTATDAIVTLDSDRRIDSFNPAAEIIFGCRAVAVRGTEFGVLVAPEHRGALAELLEAADCGPIGARTVALDGLTAQGRRLPLEISLAHWRFEAHRYVTLIARDLSTRRQVEEQLRHAQKMESVGQLTGGIAHDFNNLLLVIAGNLELLAARPGRDLIDGRLIETAQKAAERGAQLTRQLLAFARRQPLRVEAVDINRLVSNVSEMLRRTLGEKIEVETVLGGGLWPAMADAHQLDSALVNLALNARDAMPDGGRLTVETANIHLDAAYVDTNPEATAGQYVMVAVSDTGCGMAPEVAARVFEPFFTTKEPGKGTGLGLSTVYGFVKQSAGHIKIYSEPGQGTTVRIYIPRTAAAPPPLEPTLSEGQALPRGTETILVVEDDASVREYVVGVLSGLGYRVVEAPDGPAALAAVERLGHVDLLFTDVVLPRGMNGRTVAEEIGRRLTGLKVLYTSGYTSNAVVHQGRLDAGIDLLSKPYSQRDLARAVRRVLDTQ